MDERIDVAMARVERWLNSNAERISTLSLRPAASTQTLIELEEKVGKPLPEDFKALYAHHDGLDDSENLGSLFYGMDFLPLERIIREREPASDRSATALRKADPAINGDDSENLGWIRFGFDGSHTALLLDLAPTEQGRYGQIIFVDDEYGVAILVADSTAHLLESFSRHLEEGLYALDADALEDGNHYLEADQSIDIVNWASTDRWKHLEAQ